MPVQCLVRFIFFLFFIGRFISLLYFIKIEEGITLEACFDNVQGLNEFHAKSRNLVHKIAGCTLNRTKITIKDTSIPAIPLLFVAPNAMFESYKYIIDNHIQSILNFYEVRSHCQKLSNSGVSCSFKGGSNGPQEFQRFLLWRQSTSAAAVHAQLPITVKTQHCDPLPSMWRQVSDKFLKKHDRCCGINIFD